MISTKEPILYIDDEIENLEGFLFTFMNNYDITTTQSASEGLEILKNKKIKVVISDQRMPEMSGIELMKIIKEKYPDIIRIILTAYADTENAIEAINQGEIYRYLAKPWNKNDLNYTIQNALHAYNLKEENKNLLKHLKFTNSELSDKIQLLEQSEEELRQKNEEYVSLNEEYLAQNEELKKARDKAEESDKLKSIFLANLSHEIRTPINGIVGFANMMSNNEISSEQQKFYTSIIINSSYQLMRIIDDILEISKLETKQIKIINKEVCINNLLLEMFTIYDIKAKENKTPLYLKKGLNDFESTIITDESKLRKILNNLIDNALRYTNKGFIEIGYNLKDNNMEFYVRDSGIGISSEMQEKIFERFSQENKDLSTSFGGLGLGLSIAKENTEILKGTIWVESEKNVGSTFFVSIPYTFANSKIIKNEDILKMNTPDIKYFWILVAEDEEINYLYIETLLKKSKINHKILHAKNGLEAVEICKERNDINVVLMDVKMPYMNGYEATQEIKKFRPNLKIIAQTAYSMPEDEEKAIRAGCDAYISKPLQKDLFFGLLNKYLNEN